VTDSIRLDPEGDLADLAKLRANNVELTPELDRYFEELTEQRRVQRVRSLGMATARLALQTLEVQRIEAEERARREEQEAQDLEWALQQGAEQRARAAEEIGIPVEQLDAELERLGPGPNLGHCQIVAQAAQEQSARESRARTEFRRAQAQREGREYRSEEPEPIDLDALAELYQPTPENTAAAEPERTVSHAAVEESHDVAPVDPTTPEAA